jgi:hypothetical protein
MGSNETAGDEGNGSESQNTSKRSRHGTAVLKAVVYVRATEAPSETAGNGTLTRLCFSILLHKAPATDD